MLHYFPIAVLNIALGSTLEKSGTSGYTLWVVVAFGVYQFVIEVILETHNCYLIRSGNMLLSLSRTSFLDNRIRFRKWQKSFYKDAQLFHHILLER